MCFNITSTGAERFLIKQLPRSLHQDDKQHKSELFYIPLYLLKLKIQSDKKIFKLKSNLVNMTDLQSYIRKRGNLKGYLTRNKQFIETLDLNSITKTLINEVQLRVTKVEPLLDEFEYVQSQIEEHDTSIETAVHESERNSFENSYYSILATYQVIVDNNDVSETSQTSDEANGRSSVAASNHSQTASNYSETASNHSQNNSNLMPINNSYHNIKLPQLTIPTFSGEMDKWLNFYDMFNSVIHDNKNLSPVQKLQYLKGSLSGAARDILESVEIRSTNYEVAINLLKERYEDKSRIINTHIRHLFELEPLQRESYSQLQSLLNDTLKHVQALKSLNQPTEHWDSLLVYLTRTKFDSITKRDWEKDRSGLQDVPTMKDLTKFLKNKCRELEALNTTKQTGVTHNKSTRSSAHFAAQGSACKICTSGNHAVYHCGRFLQMNIPDRINEVIKHKLCKCCFRGNHTTKDCKSSNCRKCNRRHNTLLHLPNEQSNTNNNISTITDNTTNNTSPEQTETQATTVANFSQFKLTHVLLPTAIVYTYDGQGNRHKIRILLDTGSQSNFIRQDIVQQLNLKSKRVNHPVSGINNTQIHVTSEVSITLHSQYNAFKCTINCLTIPDITNDLPQTTLRFGDFNIPEHIQLADPTFTQSSKINILVGAEVFWQLMCIGQFSLGRHKPIAQKTQFGWVISGAIIQHPTSLHSSTCMFTVTDYKKLDIQNQMAAFWQIEEGPVTHSKSQQELECEQLFTETTSREGDGKFIVQLPFKDNINQLGESYNVARKRLSLLEQRLNSNSILKGQYSAFMQEYETLGHMTPVTYSELEIKRAYFLPHHPIIKPDKLTSKIRVVFDASCQTSTGLSLNDTLKVGPVVQPELITILLRFRLHKVAFTSDCEKMYRQIWVSKDHRIFQNILWNNQIYQLNTVTYGTSSAPYLATRCIEQVAIDSIHSHQEVSKLIRDSFYVDDLISSCKTVAQATMLVNQLNNLFLTYGFPMRKWSSNHPQVLENVDSVNTITHFNDDSRSVKTLGLEWDSKEDLFRYPFKIKEDNSLITKRTILSTISTIFDPLGLVSPVLIKSKIILQRLWQLNLTWDESLPVELHTMWTNYQDELPKIQNLSIPRQVLTDNSINTQIHAFCDASEVSYGICIYLRSTNTSGQHTVNLLTAKGRVAPLKVITIPKLELMAAHLLAKTVSKIQIILRSNIHVNETHYWCDSSIVLAWLRKTPNQLKTFVAHRVSDIISLTSVSDWHHIRSGDNPADIVSRGASVNQLASCQLWWNGPRWLVQDPSTWPQSSVESLINIPEVKQSASQSCTYSVSIQTQSVISKLLNESSKLIKLKRILAYCVRFINNCQKINSKIDGPLTVTEIQHSLNLLIKNVQLLSFPDEIQNLTNNTPIYTRSKLKSLNPFLDEHGLMRVGGRLRHSHVPFNTKFPFILPKKHQFTTLVINQYHLQHFHAGSQATLSAIRQMFWIISGKSEVKRLLHKCIICKRFNSKPTVPIMGDLPEGRVLPSRAFSVCGTDFAGPFLLKNGNGRGRQVTKAYLCLFVCFSTKAVHLEVVGSLSTESFLACLKRFLARRGFCREIHSDNGTNYVGANKEIKDWYNLNSNQTHSNAVTNFLNTHSIQWKFTPARSPHFGGLWESVVKSAKRHLYKIAGNSSFTFEEINTLFCQIESILNSRPLIPLSTNPQDLHFLSPAHFLVGDSLLALPEPSLIEVKQNRLSRFQMVQQMQQRFWKLWSNDYLTLLQPRSKWQRKTNSSIKPGALVLLRELNTPPLLWRMGRIIDVHPGPDGITRVVSIRTTTGTVKRSVTKIVELFNDVDNPP